MDTDDQSIFTVSSHKSIYEVCEELKKEVEELRIAFGRISNLSLEMIRAVEGSGGMGSMQEIKKDNYWDLEVAVYSWDEEALDSVQNRLSDEDLAEQWKVLDVTKLANQYKNLMPEERPKEETDIRWLMGWYRKHSTNKFWHHRYDNIGFWGKDFANHNWLSRGLTLSAKHKQWYQNSFDNQIDMQLDHLPIELHDEQVSRVRCFLDEYWSYVLSRMAEFGNPRVGRTGDPKRPFSFVPETRSCERTVTI